MSRGRRRRRPTRKTVRAATPIGGESQSSANYRAGKTVRYGARVAGPTFPVIKKHIDEPGQEIQR